MRVLVAADGFPEVSSADAGAALARAWAEVGAGAAVVPMGAAGDLTRALGDLWSCHPEVAVSDDGPMSVLVGPDAVCVSWTAGPVPGIDTQATSSALGVVVEQTMAQHPTSTVIVEVAGARWHDGGRGWMRAFGDLESARARFADVRLLLAVSREDQSTALTGLRGITSLRGRGTDGAPALNPGTLLGIDQGLVEWAQRLGVSGESPGSGAAGGLGACILALGGQVLGGPATMAELTGLDATLAHADLVVTGCDQLDFGTMGGDVLADLAERAGRQMVPLITIAGTNYISERELRTVGVEAAYAVRGDRHDSTVITPHDLTAAARLVARTWSW